MTSHAHTRGSTAPVTLPARRIVESLGQHHPSGGNPRPVTYPGVAIQLADKLLDLQPFDLSIFLNTE